MASTVGRVPSELRGRNPGQGVRGPLKLKHFWFLDDKWKAQITHFSTIWKHKEIRYLCCFCQKNMVGHEKGRGAGAKLGRPVPPIWA